MSKISFYANSGGFKLINLKQIRLKHNNPQFSLRFERQATGDKLWIQLLVKQFINKDVSI